MANLEDLTEMSFKPHVDSIFKLKLDEGKSLDLKLTEVTSGRKLSEDYECFSLLFLDEAKSSLQQRIYELEHTELGVISLFLVQIDADEKGHYYETVFNRTLKK